MPKYPIKYTARYAHLHKKRTEEYQGKHKEIFYSRRQELNKGLYPAKRSIIRTIQERDDKRIEKLEERATLESE